jgi:ABC-type transport system involved in Fe-S cluster assembly fused permease/ATPase subunit
MPRVAVVCDQVGLTCVVLISIYDIWFTIITLVTVVAYIGKSVWKRECNHHSKAPSSASSINAHAPPHTHTPAYTISVTEWRNKFRRLMNEKDNESTNKAVDSLINFGNAIHLFI